MNQPRKVIVLEKERTGYEVINDNTVRIDQKRYGSNKDDSVYLTKEQLQDILKELA